VRALRAAVPLLLLVSTAVQAEEQTREDGRRAGAPASEQTRPLLRPALIEQAVQGIQRLRFHPGRETLDNLTRSRPRER
jgi:hypothetical protein